MPPIVTETSIFPSLSASTGVSPADIVSFTTYLYVSYPSIAGIDDVSLNLTTLPTSCAVPFPLVSSAFTITLSMEGVDDFGVTSTSLTTFNIILVAASSPVTAALSLTR